MLHIVDGLALREDIFRGLPRLKDSLHAEGSCSGNPLSC